MKYILTVASLLFVLNISHAQKKVNWVSWDEAIAAATDNPKKIYIDIYTDWCGYCRKMDRETFTDPGVIKYLNENFYPVKFDAEQKESINFNETEFKHIAGGRGGVHELAVALLNNQMGYPAFVILDEEFSRILISPGYKGPSDVMMEMEFANDETYKTKTWTAFKAEKVAMARAAQAKAAQARAAQGNANAATNAASATKATMPTKAQVPSKATKPAATNSAAVPPNTMEEETFKVAEQMPRFPGCEDIDGSKDDISICAQEKMLEYIYKNLEYPKSARENGIEGMIVVQYVVGKDGAIRDAKIIRDLGHGCGDAGLKVVNSMPKWTPGMQRGKAVAVQYTLPMRFKLGKRDKVKEKLNKSK